MLGELKTSEDALFTALMAKNKAEKQLKTCATKIYYGDKTDATDLAVEKFINNYPERKNLKIMFLRESEGVYQFGSKRIHIKIEQGNKIMCRVGGGYMHIDQFMKKYQNGEAERYQKGNVIERFHNKTEI